MYRVNDEVWMPSGPRTFDICRQAVEARFPTRTMQGEYVLSVRPDP